jgi:hypothetical protein
MVHHESVMATEITGAENCCTMAHWNTRATMAKLDVTKTVLIMLDLSIFAIG